MLNAIHDRGALVAIATNHKSYKSLPVLIVQAAWGIVSQKGAHVQSLASKLSSSGEPHLSDQFGCFLRFLLVPAAPLLPDSAGQSSSAPRIGIHLRVGDAVLKKGRVRLSFFPFVCLCWPVGTRVCFLPLASFLSLSEVQQQERWRIPMRYAPCSSTLNSSLIVPSESMPISIGLASGQSSATLTT